MEDKKTWGRGVQQQPERHGTGYVGANTQTYTRRRERTHHRRPEHSCCRHTQPQRKRTSSRAHAGSWCEDEDVTQPTHSDNTAPQCAQQLYASVHPVCCSASAGLGPVCRLHMSTLPIQSTCLRTPTPEAAAGEDASQSCLYKPHPCHAIVKKNGHNPMAPGIAFQG